MSGSEEAPPTARGRGVVRGLAEIPIIAVLAVLIVVVLRAVLVQPFYIPSPSMVPQLRVNDKILVSRVSYRLHGVRRGDVVVFDAPPGIRVTSSSGNRGPLSWVTERLGMTPRTDVLVKRVIGLPGESVEGRGGHVYINGRLLIEPYLPPGTAASAPDFSPTKIPPKMVWVMGDNRGNSEDSHVFGPIPKHTIVGRVVVKIWPLDDLSFL